MTDGQKDDGRRPSFTEQLWSMDEESLIQHYLVAKREGDPATVMAILQAKSMIASRDAADESRRVAKATKWLAWATVAMALATIVMAAVAVWNPS